MPLEYADDVAHAVNHMQMHWEGRIAPIDAVLARCRRLINAADNLLEPPSEETQAALDQLHGYFVWGRMMSSIAYLDPRHLAAERAERRARDAAFAAWREEQAEHREKGEVAPQPLPATRRRGSSGGSAKRR